MHDADTARPNCPRSFAAFIGAWLLATVAATIAMAVIACSGGNLADRDLVVTSYSPTQSSDGDAPLRVQFDHPVVGADAVGRPIDTPPVVLQPAATVRAHWIDRQTLVVVPDAPLRPSTHYTLALTGDLARRTGGFELSFVNHPLAVEAISGVDLRRLPQQPSLPIQFNQEVAVNDVVAHCSIRGAVGDPPISVVTEEPAGDSAASLTVRPATALAQGSDYSLVCDGLTGAGGDAPIAEAYSASLHTYPAMAVANVGPDGYDVPADEVNFQIHLSTPVSLDAIRAALKIHPAVPGFDNGWLDKTGTVYRVTADLKTQTNYELTLKKGLTDIYGQKLAADSVHSFHTGDAKPRLVVQTGIYAVEPASGGYPVWTRNVKKFDVSCAAVPAKQVVALLTSSMDYDPWYDAQDTSVSWKQLGLKQHDRKVAIDQPKNKWHLSRVNLRDSCGGTAARGLYLAAMSSSDVKKDADEPWRYHPSRRILANVTDLGILTKAGTASGLIWVASISTGKPVGGAKVDIYTPQGRLAFRGTTDKDGILRTPGTTTLLRQPGARDKDDYEQDPEEDFWSYRSQRLIVVVEHAGDLGVVDGNWANGIQTWNFGVPEDRRSGDTRIRGFIQSDRGIYRPGETVHFKGIVREIEVGKAPVVPGKTPVAITVEDARGQSVYTAKKKLSRFGGFYFDLPLTESASLGDYYVRANVKGQTFHERFSVEEFRKVTYELKLRGAKRQAHLGDRLTFDLDANYLFGAPVNGASVSWSVERRSHYVSFSDYPEYGFADWAAKGDDYWSRWDRSSYSSYLTDGEGETDAKGRMKIRVSDPQVEFDGPQDYILNAQVTDETDQTVSKTTVVTAHKTDFYLGLHTQEYVQAVGMPFSVNVVALSPEGKPVATRAKLSLIRQDYQCTDSDGYRAYRTCKAVHKVAMERDIDIAATGVDMERIMPEHPGEYFIRVEAVDGRGNPVASSDYVWILGKGEAFWSGDESARMGLIASKRQYQPGEIARLVPRTGLKNATALVTLERNGILDAKVVHLANASEGISLPLTGAHAPNVFATVAMVTGRTGPGDARRPRFKMGMVDLEVSPDAHRLKVEVATERGEYRPGDEVKGTITVTSGGKPVAAEVSLSVADEGVLQLIAYKTPDPMQSFYASWGMGIDNSTNWNRIARLDDPSVIDPDEGGDSGGDGEPGVRSRFVQSAYWAPALVTDEHGAIAFHFRAPDNLTAFRLMAVAADDGSRFGSGDRRITVKKPLLLEPVLPRFLTSGDDAEVGVVVRNYTGAAGTAKGRRPRPRRGNPRRDGQAGQGRRRRQRPGSLPHQRGRCRQRALHLQGVDGQRQRRAGAGGSDRPRADSRDPIAGPRRDHRRRADHGAGELAQRQRGRRQHPVDHRRPNRPGRAGAQPALPDRIPVRLSRADAVAVHPADQGQGPGQLAGHGVAQGAQAARLHPRRRGQGGPPSARRRQLQPVAERTDLPAPHRLRQLRSARGQALRGQGRRRRPRPRPGRHPHLGQRAAAHPGSGRRDRHRGDGRLRAGRGGQARSRPERAAVRRPRRPAPLRPGVPPARDGAGQGTERSAAHAGGRAARRAAAHRPRRRHPRVDVRRLLLHEALTPG